MQATMELADVIIVNYGLHYQVRVACVLAPRFCGWAHNQAPHRRLAS